MIGTSTLEDTLQTYYQSVESMIKAHIVSTALQCPDSWYLSAPGISWLFAEYLDPEVRVDQFTVVVSPRRLVERRTN